jgi:hypothetical protein
MKKLSENYILLGNFYYFKQKGTSKGELIVYQLEDYPVYNYVKAASIQAHDSLNCICISGTPGFFFTCGLNKDRLNSLKLWVFKNN